MFSRNTLVNIPLEKSDVEIKSLAMAVEPTQNQRDSVPVFLTPQSIVSFPVASSVVYSTWIVLGKIFPSWGMSGLVLLFIAFLAGTLIYLISATEQMTQKEKIIGIIIAIFNSFFLAASALGLNVAL